MTFSKRYRVSALLLSAGIIAFSGVLTLIRSYRKTGSLSRPELLPDFAGTFFFTAMTALLVLAVVKYFKGMSTGKLKSRLPFIFICFTLLMYLMINLSVALESIVRYRVNGLDTYGYIYHLFNHELPWGDRMKNFLVFICCAGLFLFLWFRKEYHKSTIRERNLRAENEILKTIVRHSGSSFPGKLAGGYPSDNGESLFTPLEEELDFTREYLHFREKKTGIKVRLNETGLHPGDYRTVPFFLNCLLENALQSIEPGYDEPVSIDILTEAHTLIVRFPFHTDVQQLFPGNGRYANGGKKFRLLRKDDVMVLQKDEVMEVRLNLSGMGTI